MGQYEMSSERLIRVLTRVQEQIVDTLDLMELADRDPSGIEAAAALGRINRNIEAEKRRFDA